MNFVSINEVIWPLEAIFLVVLHAIEIFFSAFLTIFDHTIKVLRFVVHLLCENSHKITFPFEIVELWAFESLVVFFLANVAFCL